MSKNNKIRSMTGFGRYQNEDNGLVQIWEIRSVNSRHLDPKWRLPVQVRALESRLDRVLRQFAGRGRVEISLNLQYTQASAQASFDAAQAGAALDSLRAFARERGDDYQPDYNSLLSIPVFWNQTGEQDDEALFQQLKQGFSLALEDWNTSRVTEGAQLAADLRARFAYLADLTSKIAAAAPQIKDERLSQVRERVTEMLKALDSDLDESRFLQEMVLLADRLDVSEELTRLSSHLLRLAELLDIGEDCGRKLDFTLQECFREINTCGNKIQDAVMSRLVVDYKNELEKCREQVQNLE